VAAVSENCFGMFAMRCVPVLIVRSLATDTLLCIYMCCCSGEGVRSIDDPSLLTMRLPDLEAAWPFQTDPSPPPVDFGMSGASRRSCLPVLAVRSRRRQWCEHGARGSARCRDVEILQGVPAHIGARQLTALPRFPETTRSVNL
jgi:hypothetical protein